MLFSHIDYLDQDLNVVRDQFVGVRDGRIDHLGPKPPQDPQAYGETYDGHGKLLMPALYNAHAHAPMTLLRGYAEGLTLQSWLNDKVFPFEAMIGPDQAGPATALAIAEMVRHGVVSFSDMYYHDDARCEAVADAQVKCNVSHAVTSFGQTDYQSLPAAGAGKSLLDNWHGACDGRIRADLSIHAEYTNNEAVCRAIAELAQEHGVAIHVHVSETESEVRECRERHGGLSPAAFLAGCGVFDVPAIAAHCVWVDDDDIDILGFHGVSVACCPASNMKLASGFAPVPRMLERGVNVALGTDGPASNNAHNMFRDLYLFATVYKGASGDPTVVSPRQALHAATRAGAVAQGRHDCGIVAKGMRADLCVLDMTGPAFCPGIDVLSDIVYAADGSEVCLTMCDGVVVYRDGAWPTIDVERAKSLTRSATLDIMGRLARG